VFTARYALSPYIKQIQFVFKGLILSYVAQINKRYNVIRRSFVSAPIFLQLRFKLLDSSFYTTTNIKEFSV
jgi:hypothetical protein